MSDVTDAWRELDRTFEYIQDRLLEYYHGLDATEIHRNSLLVDDLGVDSLGRMNLLLDLEETYGIKLVDEDFDVFNTQPISAIVRMVYEKRGFKDTGILPHGVV